MKKSLAEVIADRDKPYRGGTCPNCNGMGEVRVNLKHESRIVPCPVCNKTFILEGDRHA